MANNGTEGSVINRNTARVMMQSYRNSPAFAANNGQEGVLFGKDHIEAILAQPGCVGIRIYYGKDGPLPGDPANLILVGTDANNHDMSDLIVDMGIPCPTHCPPAGSKI